MNDVPFNPEVDWNDHWQNYTEATERNPGQLYRRRIARLFLERFGCSCSSRILDIGSGQGDLALDLRRAFPTAELAGVELSETGVRISAQKVPDARFFERDLLQPADPGPLKNWAQFAVCSEVLEHLDDPAAFLANAAHYLAPGCALVVTVPGGPKSKFDLHIGHRLHYTPAMLKDLLTRSGFVVERATTAGFPFFNLYRLVVILRGSSLIDDVHSQSGGPTKLLARVVMATFRLLCRLNLTGTNLGWQTIAIARWPGQ